jgi:membrane protein DedA with SNARE-associated domain
MNEIIRSLAAYGGPVLFAAIFMEQAGLPLPAVPWLLAAGALSAGGEMNAAVAIGMSVVACVSADSLWFYAGRRGGNRVVQLLCRFPLAPNFCFRRTKGLFDRQGLRGIVIAKFLPGLGIVMPPLAGALGVSVARFLLCDSLGSFLYSAFYIVVGAVFHNRLRQTLALLQRFWFIALLLALVLVPGYIALRYVRRRSHVIGRTSHKASESAEPWMSNLLVCYRERAANRSNELTSVRSIFCRGPSGTSAASLGADGFQLQQIKQNQTTRCQLRRKGNCLRRRGPLCPM